MATTATATSPLGTFQRRGKKLLSEQSLEDDTKFADIFAIFLAHVVNGAIPMQARDRLEAALEAANQAVREGTDPLPALGAGSSTSAETEQERRAVAAVRSGQLEFDDSNRLVIPTDDTAVLDLVQRLEKATGKTPNKGDSLDNRIEDVVSQAKPVKVDPDNDDSETLAKVLKALGLDKDASPDDIQAKVKEVLDYKNVCDQAVNVLTKKSGSEPDGEESMVEYVTRVSELMLAHKPARRMPGGGRS